MPEFQHILMIVLDQMPAQAVGCYGNSHVQTPQLDALAARGMRFDAAYTACPLSQPARAAFWTGLLPHRTGIDSNGQASTVPDLPEEIPTLGTMLSGNNVDVVHFGRLHESGCLRGARRVDPPDNEVKKLTEPPRGLGEQQDVATVSSVAAFLRHDHEKPFAAVVDLHTPHDICDWIDANEGLHEVHEHPNALPPLPANFEINDITHRPRPVQYICCSHRRLQQAAQWSELNYREYLATYFRYVQRTDQVVGDLLEALGASPHAQDTLVMLWADHGEGMAAHRMVTKQVSFYEETNRVPLIISGPGIQVGTCTHPVSLLDVVPTLCELCHAEGPETCDGISLANGLLHGKWPQREWIAGEWTTEWGLTLEPGRMIRSANHKYTYYLEGRGEELYDLRTDPGETRNLAGHPGSADLLQQHQKLLALQVEQTRDPFFSQEWKVDPQWRSHEPGYTNHTGHSVRSWHDWLSHLSG